MRRSLYKQRHAIWQKEINISFFLPIFILLTSVIALLIANSPVQAATSNTLNFQGRLLTNTGGLVADGSYNIEFNLYTAASGGVSEWTETRLNSASQGVTVKNGYFSAYLGDKTAFPSTIDWDQEHWLGMTVRGTSSCAFAGCTPADLEMTPRFKLSSVPYAFRAGAITDAAGNAYTGDDLIQKSPSSAQAVNSALAAIRLNQAGAGGLLQLQGNGVDVFTVDNDGATTISGGVLAKNTNDSASAFDIQNVAGDSFLRVNTSTSTATFGSNSGSATTILQGGSGGVQITSGSNITLGTSDGNGTLLVLDDKTTDGDPLGANGAMYYNSFLQRFRCYENGAWTNCIGGSSSGSSHANFISGLQNVPANGSGLTVETLVFTSATAVSNVAGATGFTAPADGSFRTCLIKNNAAVTNGTLALRWTVNGVSVGSTACEMNTTNNRQSSTALNPGVVSFSAGDTIGLAFDTSSNFTPTTTEYTVYWSVEYQGTTSGGSGGDSLQAVYDNSLDSSILTANNKDLTIQLADTTIDSNFVIDILSGSSSRFVLQNNGVETLSIDKTGSIVTDGGITLGSSSSTTAGTIRWTGLDFEGFDGSSWISLTNGSGSSSISSNYVNVSKPTNEVVNGSNVLQPDDDLNFPIGPNESWTFRYLVQGNAAAAADFQFSVSAPVGSSCVVGFSDTEGAVSVGNVGCGVTSGLIPGNGTVDVYEIVGTVTNGPNAGNVNLNWAQQVSNASNTIVYAGSYVTAYRTIGAGGNGQPLTQSGNSFGTTATIGTSDNNSVSIITNGVERININTAGLTVLSDSVNIGGLTTLSDSLIASNSTTGISGTTNGTGSSTNTLTLSADVFNVNDVVLIDNAGQDYYTRVTSDGGGGNYTVSPVVSFENGRPVSGYDIQNIGATSDDYSTQANRFFQGYFLGGIVVGTGTTTISDGAINSTTTLRIQEGGGDLIIGGGLTINGAISGDGSGLSNIDGSSVDGTTLDNLNASNLTSGTLSDSLLSSNVALLTGSQTFTGAKTFSNGLTISGGNISAGSANITTTGQISGTTIVGNGSGLTNLEAGDIASGTLADARLSTNVTLLGNTFNGNNQLVRLTGAGALPTLDGSGLTNLSSANLVGALPGLSGANLTNLDANNIATGTVADARLSTNVALLSGSQTFSGAKTFSNGLTVSGGNIAAGSANITTTGQISGATIVGNGSGLTNIEAGDIASGTLADGRLSTNVALLSGSQTFTGSKTFGNGLTLSSGNLDAGAGNVTSTGQISGATIIGNGAGLTNLEAGDIASGTLADGRLSTNVALLSGSQTFTGSKSFSGGLVLGLTSLSSSATIARSVALPDEAGTICLSNANTCGYLRLASGAAQTDASNNDVLSVNKTSATGNLISLQRNAGAVFTVANTGALQIQSTGTTALDIRNVGGTSYFSVDTSTGNVRIGSATADGVGVLFVLDTKNTAGDPTGVNGAMYYNSNDAKNRCFEDGFWSDCTSMRVLGETTLSTAGNTITVNLLDNVEYLHCRIDIKGRSTNNGVYLRFNADNGAASYGWNEYDIIAATIGDAQDNSDSEIQLTGTDTSNIAASADMKITNFLDTQKIVDWSYSGATAVGTNNRRYSGTGNWASTTAQINVVRFITSTGNFNAGSHAWCEGRNIR